MLQNGHGRVAQNSPQHSDGPTVQPKEEEEAIHPDSILAGASTHIYKNPWFSPPKRWVSCSNVSPVLSHPHELSPGRDPDTSFLRLNVIQRRSAAALWHRQAFTVPGTCQVHEWAERERETHTHTLSCSCLMLFLVACRRVCGEDRITRLSTHPCLDLVVKCMVSCGISCFNQKLIHRNVMNRAPRL